MRSKDTLRYLFPSVFVVLAMTALIVAQVFQAHLLGTGGSETSLAPATIPSVAPLPPSPVPGPGHRGAVPCGDRPRSQPCSHCQRRPRAQSRAGVQPGDDDRIAGTRRSRGSRSRHPFSTARRPQADRAGCGLPVHRDADPEHPAGPRLLRSLVDVRPPGWWPGAGARRSPGAPDASGQAGRRRHRSRCRDGRRSCHACRRGTRQGNEARREDGRSGIHRRNEAC